MQPAESPLSAGVDGSLGVLENLHEGLKEHLLENCWNRAGNESEWKNKRAGNLLETAGNC
jgi:hypothetical protein